MHDTSTLISLAARLTDGLVTINDEGRIIFVNEAACNLTGYSKGEMVGQSFSNLFDPYDAQQSSGNQPPIKKVFLKKEEVYYQSKPRGRDLSVNLLPADIPNTVPAIAVKAIALIRNNQASAENDPRSARIQMIGHFATGVAHDINNDLTAIKLSVELTQKLLDQLLAISTPESQELLRNAAVHLGDTETITNRTATLTKQLLAYARQKRTDKEAVNINASVRETLKLVRKIIDEKITIETNLAELLPPVLAERSQIDRILTNLILNARDAMSKGGILRIETAWCYLDEEFTRDRPPWAKTGRYVHLSVSDTGKGMDEETKRRIYDQFFTTKAQGSGVGLKTVYQIVKDNAGMIDVWSEVGEGTRFDIYLPPSEKRPSRAARQKEHRQLPEPQSRGQYLILVAEDKVHLRELMGQIISQAGYQVELAGDGLEGVNKYQSLLKEGKRIALTILDIGMPVLDGRSAKDRIRQLDKNAPIVLTSIYDEEGREEENAGQKDYEFLQKPFGGYTLLEKIETCLEKLANAETQLTGS